MSLGPLLSEKIPDQDETLIKYFEVNPKYISHALFDRYIPQNIINYINLKKLTVTNYNGDLTKLIGLTRLKELIIPQYTRKLDSRFLPKVKIYKKSAHKYIQKSGGTADYWYYQIYGSLIQNELITLYDKNEIIYPRRGDIFQNRSDGTYAIWDKQKKAIFDQLGNSMKISGSIRTACIIPYEFKFLDDFPLGYWNTFLHKYSAYIHLNDIRRNEILTSLVNVSAHSTTSKYYSAANKHFCAANNCSPIVSSETKFNCSRVVSSETKNKENRESRMIIYKSGFYVQITDIFYQIYFIFEKHIENSLERIKIKLRDKYLLVETIQTDDYDYYEEPDWFEELRDDEAVNHYRSVFVYMDIENDINN